MKDIIRGYARKRPYRFAMVDATMWLTYLLMTLLTLPGLLLFFGGLARLWRRKPIAGSLRGLAGLVMVFAGISVLLIGMNLYTYHRLTSEAPVATVSFAQIEPQLYEVTLVADDDVPRLLRLRGDEWQLDVRMIKWYGVATLLGAQPVYRLDRLSGRYRQASQEVRNVRTVYDLGVEHGLDLWAVAGTYRNWIPWVDAIYGSAVYMPMADKASYHVTIAGSGLVVRPANESAQQAVKAWQ